MFQKGSGFEYEEIILFFLLKEINTNYRETQTSYNFNMDTVDIDESPWLRR